MTELASEIEIAASAATVWRILTDFEHYTEWNPFIRQAQGGEARLGAGLDVTIHPPDGKPTLFGATLTRVVPQRELRWLGHFILPGLVDGEHIFLIEPLTEPGSGSPRVRFVQKEVFKGVLVRFMGTMLARTQRGFEQMNAALKARAEHEQQA